MALRAAAHVAARAARAGFRRPSPIGLVVRRLSSEYNPLIHTHDKVDEGQVVTELDLGDGKKQPVYERISGAPEPEHTPPLKLSGTVGKITSNIYIFASQKGALDDLEKDFKKIKEELVNSETWLDLRSMTTEEKVKFLEEAMNEMQLSEFTKELLPYMAKQKLLKYLPEVIDQFMELIKAKRGDIDVLIASADPLDENVLHEIEQGIKNRLGSESAGRVSIKTEVDPELIAGIRVYFNNQLIDNTVAPRLEKVRQEYAKTYAEQMGL